MRALRILLSHAFTFLIVLLSVTVCLASSPQNGPPRDQRSPSQAGTAVIRGRIVSGDTGRPLRRVRITVDAPELGGNGRNTTSDIDGRYEVTDLPAGHYTLSAARSGYLTLRYGQRRPLELGRPLEVHGKETIDHLDFALPRMGVIAGRITDETGDPIENVTVVAMRSRYWEGRRQLVPTGRGLTQTDDTGQFRLLGLTPGTYFVMASTRETWSVKDGGVLHTMGYAPTYFPGTALSTEARRVTVAIGGEVGNTDFALSIGRAAIVSGTAVDSQGRPFGDVTLREEIRGEGFARFGGGKSATVAPDGSFSIRDVSPGEYTLTSIAGRDGDHPEVATLPLRVDGVDMTDLRLTGSEGGSIAGQVLTDTGVVPPIPRLRVSIGLPSVGQPDPALMSAFRSPGFSSVSADGSFAIRGIFGRSRLRVVLPDDWMVRSILYEGRDITDVPIELKDGERWSGVQVIITDRVSTVAGQLTDEKGVPVTDATVLLFAEDSQAWRDDSRAVRAVRPDQNGQYAVKGLPAGLYLAVAMEYMEDGTWNDPEFLESLRRYAQKVSVDDATTQMGGLKLVKPDDVR